MKTLHISLLTLCFIFTGCSVTPITSVNTKHEVRFDQDEEDEYDVYEYYAPKIKENK